MHLKKITITVITFGILLLLVAFILNITHVWKNNSYRILFGKHLSLSSDNKSFFWFDVRHSNNPDDIMFKDIETCFYNFAPDLVLVEGGANTFEGNRIEAILDGENSFATYLAKQNGIAVEDIEPPFSKQIEYLQTKYPPDEILAMYLIRQTASIALLPENIEYDLYAELLNDTRFFIENGLDYKSTDIESVLETVNTYLPQSINQDNWKSQGKNLYKVCHKDDGIIHSVYNDVYNYRNIYLVELIRERREHYGNIFIVMGGAHLRDTKAQLEDIYYNH